MSWRDGLPIHPAADLFPMMTDAELRDLGADIKANGMRVPITLWKEAKDWKPVLLDGRNRLAAMEVAGIEIITSPDYGSEGDPQIRLYFRRDGEAFPIPTVEVRGDHLGGDPAEYVVSANLLRRHLTPDQKRSLIANILKSTPQKSNWRVAKQVNVDHKTVANVRAEQEATGEIPQLKETTGADGKARPARKASSIAKVVPKAQEAKRTEATQDSIETEASSVEKRRRGVEKIEAAARAAAEAIADALPATVLAQARRTRSLAVRADANVGSFDDAFVRALLGEGGTP